MRALDLITAVETMEPQLVVMAQETYHRIMRKEEQIAQRAGLSLDPQVYSLLLNNVVGETRFVFSRNPNEPTRFVYDCEVFRHEELPKLSHGGEEEPEC